MPDDLARELYEAGIACIAPGIESRGRWGAETNATVRAVWIAASRHVETLVAAAVAAGTDAVSTEWAAACSDLAAAFGWSNVADSDAEFEDPQEVHTLANNIRARGGA